MAPYEAREGFSCEYFAAQQRLLFLTGVIPEYENEIFYHCVRGAALCRAFADFFFRTNRHIDWDRATPDTDISAALPPSRRLYLDPGLLGLRYRLLLGPWRLDPSTARRVPLDPRILGLQREQLLLQRGLLGSDRRVLRGNQLRLRLRGTRLLRRTVGWQYLPL